MTTKSPQHASRFPTILKAKVDYYGQTAAAFDFAADEYTRQVMQNTAESCRQQLQNDADLKRKLAEKHKDDTRMSSYFETMAEQMEMAIYIFNLYFPPENKTTDANTDQPQTQAV